MLPIGTALAELRYEIIRRLWLQKLLQGATSLSISFKQKPCEDKIF